MITKNNLIKGVNSFVSDYVDKIALDNPVVCLAKPIITRAVDKQLDKYSNMLDLITDKEGNIDMEGILTEISESLMKVNPFSINVPVLGNINIGGGKIGMDIPYINKHIMFDRDDLDYLKELLTTNSYGRNIIGGIPEK